MQYARKILRHLRSAAGERFISHVMSCPTRRRLPQLPVSEHCLGSGPPSPESSTLRPVASSASCIFVSKDAAVPGHDEQLSSCITDVDTITSNPCRLAVIVSHQVLPAEKTDLDVVHTPFGVLFSIDSFVAARRSPFAATLVAHCCVCVGGTGAASRTNALQHSNGRTKLQTLYLQSPNRKPSACNRSIMPCQSGNRHGSDCGT